MGVDSESDSNVSREFLDVQQVVREIRQRTRGLVPPNSIEPSRRSGFVPPPPPPVPKLVHSEAFATLIENGALLAGDMPAMPPTFRGKVGKWMVAIVRRMLFWYIPQVHSYQRASAQAVRELAEALRGIERCQRQWHSAWTDLHRDLVGLTEEIRSARIRLDAIEESSHQNLTHELRSRLEGALRQAERTTHQIKAGL